MAYPGDPSLDDIVQQRVLAAFAEAVRLHRDGQSDESRTILRSITEVDPRFAPAQRLEQAIAAGAPVDLGQLIGEVTAQSSVDVEATLAKARQAFAQRSFQDAATLARAVLHDLPGHAEARRLALDAQAQVKAGGEIQTHIARAREALDAGLVEEARGFLKLAKDVDPRNPDVAVLEQRLQLAAKPLETEGEPEFEFEVFEHIAEAPHPQAAAPAPPTPTAHPPEPKLVPPAPPATTTPPAPPRTTPQPQMEPPPPPAATAPPRREGGFRFDEAGDSAAMEFHPGFGEEPGATGGGAGAAQESAARVQALLAQGQEEFDRGDFQAAIDTWSRIYLIDAENSEAEHRISQARQRREEVDRLAEQRFHEALDAFEQKRLEDARALCQEVIKLQPQHLEAHDLLQRLETPAAPPPPVAPALGGEEDLFHDDFVPAATAAPPAGSHAAPARVAVPQAVGERAGSALRVRLQLPAIPLPWLGVGVGVVVLLLVAGLLLRGKVFTSGGGAVAEALAESEQLAKQGRLQQAVQLLQSLQGQVEGEQANRINQRVLEYQRRLKSKAAPPPVSESKFVADALARGHRVKAMQLLRAGLEKVPGDPELLKLESEIRTYSASMPALADAVADSNWERMRNLSAQILKEHPDDVEMQQAWAVATFNAAVGYLRKYQVAQGHALLMELTKRNPDPEAERLQELAKSYLSRPADPRYQIFVTNVELRTFE
jgi:tetratricopeptide (TPR) repeat protein